MLLGSGVPEILQRAQSSRMRDPPCPPSLAHLHSRVIPALSNRGIKSISTHLTQTLYLSNFCGWPELCMCRRLSARSAPLSAAALSLQTDDGTSAGGDGHKSCLRCER